MKLKLNQNIYIRDKIKLLIPKHIIFCKIFILQIGHHMDEIQY